MLLPHSPRMAQFHRHPDRLTAVATGEKKWRGPACTEHPEALRWTSSGQCVDCSRERSLEQARAQAAARIPYVPIPRHPARLAAIAAGARTFEGPPCRHGHPGTRYVGGNQGCVDCARAWSAGPR